MRGAVDKTYVTVKWRVLGQLWFIRVRCLMTFDILTPVIIIILHITCSHPSSNIQFFTIFWLTTTTLIFCLSKWCVLVAPTESNSESCRLPIVCRKSSLVLAIIHGHCVFPPIVGNCIRKIEKPITTFIYIYIYRLICV